MCFLDLAFGKKLILVTNLTFDFICKWLYTPTIMNSREISSNLIVPNLALVDIDVGAVVGTP